MQCKLCGSTSTFVKASTRRFRLTLNKIRYLYIESIPFSSPLQTDNLLVCLENNSLSCIVIGLDKHLSLSIIHLSVLQSLFQQ